MNRSISTLGVCLLLGGGALVETVQNRPALKDVFKEAFAIGTAVNNVIVSGKDPESRDLVLRHFASITADNAMKAGPINPRPGEFNFGPADAFVAFGEAHGMFIAVTPWYGTTRRRPGSSRTNRKPNTRRPRSNGCAATLRLGGSLQRAGARLGRI